MNDFDQFQRQNSKKKQRKFLFALLSTVGLTVLLTGAFFLWKLVVLEKKVSQNVNFGQGKTVTGQKDSTLLDTTKNILTNEKKALKGSEKKRINLLLLGMGGEGHKGKYLTDTIMLVSINPENFQTAFLSIPRDLYVRIPDTTIHTKINAVYAYETENGKKLDNQPLETLKKLIQEITGQEVNYYLALDFDGFQKIIDDLGGIEVEVAQDILDERYPGPNFSYETFALTKGFHHLDGEVALKYARVRHVAGGDFGRAERQQKVLIAAKNKAFSRETFLSPAKLNSLLTDLGNHIRTDITLEEIPSFWELAKNINVYQATNKVLDAWSPDSLLASSHVLLGGQIAYVLLPRGKNYSAIQELANNLFDLKFLDRQKEAIVKENASLAILAENGSVGKTLYTLKKMGYNQARLFSEKIPSSQLCLEKSFLYYKKEAPAKPFSLDNLSKELEATIAELPTDIPLDQDFLLCLAKPDSQYFSLQNEKEADEDEALKEKSILKENGEILFNQN